MKLRSVENVEYGKCECGNIERFPFEQKLRKFRFGVKRKTFFGLSGSCSKGSPVFFRLERPDWPFMFQLQSNFTVKCLNTFFTHIISFSIALRIPTAHDSHVISTPTRALERTHNVSNYSQTKPDSEMRKCSFYLKRVWWPILYFVLHKFCVNRILFKLKKEKLVWKEKKKLHCSKCPKRSAYQGCFNNLNSSYRKMYLELVKWRTLLGLNGGKISPS